MSTPLDRRALVHVQLPIELDVGSEPEPDIALIRVRADFYESAAVLASDVFFILEIADSSLSYDLHDKALAYSRNDIPEYWVENLLDDIVVVHRDPSAEGYRSVETYRRGQRLRLVALPIEVEMTDVLGPGTQA